MDMIGRTRSLHSRKKKSEREISRITGLSRNTVSKWLHGEVDGPPKYRRGEQPGKLTVFHEALKQALKADARRPKHERRTAKALYAEIKAAGYDGGYTRVTDFIRSWRQGEGQAVTVNAFVPLAFELGEAYQFDWSEEGRPLVVSCGTQQTEWPVVVEPGGHVGRLPLSLSTCPRGGSQEYGFERWRGGAVHRRIGSASTMGGAGCSA